MLTPHKGLEEVTTCSGENNLAVEQRGRKSEFLSAVQKAGEDMNTSDFKIKARDIEINEYPVKSLGSDRGPSGLDNSETDLVADELMETFTSNPLGRLLSMISSLPEIRHEKVSQVRHQIRLGEYNISENLDVALDRVLEEFIAD